MARSVYSVVLDDDVVAALDAAALRAGVSRSAMMNRLLAAQLEYATPEERIRTVLEGMQRLADSRYTALQAAAPAAAQLLLRSALRCKYNPTMRYTVELYPHSDQYLGVLRCQLRTQNALLVQALERFYRLWCALEQSGLGVSPALQEVAGARFARVLRLPAAAVSEQQLAERLTGYVALLDSCVKLYCERLDDPNAALLAAAAWREGVTDEVAAL